MSPLDVERATMRAWPADETYEHRSGWFFLAASGVTGRVNAVWPLAWRGGDVDAAIDDAEAWYRARKLPPRFKLTDDAIAPADLAQVLQARGYEQVMHTLIMTRELATPAGQHTDVDIAERLPATFDEALRASTPEPDELEERRSIARRAPRQTAFALRGGERALAVGMSAMAGDLTGVFLMRTLPEARRQGHARHILRALLDWASANGAKSAFLQVEAANEAAVALYKSEGFTTLTSYHFWRRAS